MVNNKGGQCRIENNVISNNAENGIHLTGYKSSAVIITNEIYDHGKCGIYVSDSAEPHIENNELARNNGANIEIDESCKENAVVFGNLEDCTDLNIL